MKEHDLCNIPSKLDQSIDRGTWTMLINSEVKIFQPSNILDSASTASLSQDIDNALQAGVKQMLIDLQSVSFIDSSGLGGLVSSFKSVRLSGGTLSLCSINEQPRMLLEITGIDQVFDIYASQQEFAQSVSSSS
ncbi:STAS domain-containing protein [Leptolyngbyaceae cyanobacterium UHCC 1019]